MKDANPDDHAAITQVIQRYFEALDEKEYQRLEQVFTPDAILRYSLDESAGPPVTYPAMVTRLREFNAAFRFTQHLSGPSLIAVDGDTAAVRTNLRALHVQERRSGGRSIWVVHGVYRDRLVRLAAGWRIAERIFRVVDREGELLGAAEVVLYDRPPWR